jgi:hypothetical protein
MSTFRNPVGPQPSNVYWRRRLIVLLGLIAVVVIIVLIVTRPGSADADKQPAGATESNQPTDGETSAPPASGEVTECDPSVLKLEAVTDKGEYAAGETPMISMTLTNNGALACTINAGTDVQELVVGSGEDQYWSSKDCQTNPAAAPITLEPGVPQATSPIPWERVRSSVDTCEGERPEVTAGGASYHLTVRLGDIESERKRFLLY